MSAARLDPFSARLHAIHRKGAKAASKPALRRPPSPLLENSAPEGATTGMPVREEEARRLLGDDNDEALDDVRRLFGDDNDGYDMRASLHSAIDDDDEPSGAGHFATNLPRDERTHEREEAYAEQRAAEERLRTDAREDDAREDIRMIRRRLSALENEVMGLKERLDAWDRPADPFQRLSFGGE